MNVAVVGGGASGTIAAIRLLEALPGGRVSLIERSGIVGRGIAYSTEEERHRLNVRAADMSLHPEAPDEFVVWLESRPRSGMADHPAPVRSQFVPRRLFALYLEDALARAAANSGAELHVVHDEAISLSGSRTLRVGLRSGGDLTADHAVLAIGNLRPSLPFALAGPIEASRRVIADPWPPGALATIGADDDVLIVGTGLTMVDTALSLIGQGHRGRILARSRHGLLPLAHRICGAAAFEWPEEARRVSTAIQAIRACGDGWRDAMDALRPRANELWQSLSWPERARFRRRLQAFWDVHRHRIPEDVAELLNELQASGQVNIGTGSVRNISACESRLKVESGSDRLLVGWIINCTGPAGDLRAAQVPIVESAISAGLAEYDPLGAGLTVDHAGRVYPSANIWALGALCRGCRLETTAVPEIRWQAKRLAEAIARAVGP